MHYFSFDNIYFDKKKNSPKMLWNFKCLEIDNMASLILTSVRSFDLHKCQWFCQCAAVLLFLVYTTCCLRVLLRFITEIDLI